METLTLILALSCVMWYIIDRFKELWSELKYGKFITIAVAAVFGFALAFGFNLDLINAVGLVPAPTTLGIILTGLVLMSGSSAVAEIIERIKGEH